MADRIFADPRLAAIYDVLDGPRDDLAPYLDLVDEFGATEVLDVGCGTGTFATALAAHGVDVYAVDPAAASIAVARTKIGAGEVRWYEGTVSDLPRLSVDVATMTANVAQVFVTDDEWEATLTGVCARLRPGGLLVFETRDPSAAAWTRWNRASSHSRTDLPGDSRGVGGTVESWVELVDVSLPLVRFRWTFVFEPDGAVLTSDSTLRFRSERELRSALEEHGYVVEDVRDAPDRPGEELVFVARRY